MAAMAIYGVKINLGLELYQVCSNDDHRLIFDRFMAKVNFVSLDLYGGKS